MTIADSVFVNASVLTMNDTNDVAQALAVKDGIIVAVGSEEEIQAHVGTETKVVDLGGGTLLPGINDSHCHAIAYGLSIPPLTLDVSYPNVKSIADVAELIKAAAAQAQPGEWITGLGWDLGFLQEIIDDPSRMPSRFDIDAVSPNNPVLMHDFSLHTVWVNSKAIELAGVTRDTPEPEGSKILKTDDGEPLGIFNEKAQDLISAAMPPIDYAVRMQAAKNSIKVLNSLGITSITEPGLGKNAPRGGLQEEGLQVYADLVNSDELTVRVTALRFPNGMTNSYEKTVAATRDFKPVEQKNTRLFNITGVKFMADGIPPNLTAWMHDEYACGGGHGQLTIDGNSDEERVEELNKMIKHCHDQGWQIGVHVTGDRGVEAVVDAMVKAQEENPMPDPRHYVIHADFITAEKLELCRKYGFGVNMNPAIKWTIADLEVHFVGEELAAYEWPYKTAVDSGAMVMSSSDAPVTAPDWRQGLSTMILRESKATQTVSGADQRIDLMDALRTYTINGAWQDFAEDWKGSLEVGKVADLCALKENLQEIDPHDIPKVTVTHTVIDGKFVHEA